MKFSPRQMLALIKSSPEKVISWLLLIIFISLSSYLSLTWLKKTAPAPLEEMVIRQERTKPFTEADILVDFGGLLTKKPITYYADIAQRNPFSRLVDPPLVPPEEKRRKKIERMEALLAKLNIVGEYREYYEKYLAREYNSTLQGLDVRNMEKELRRLIDLGGNLDSLEEFLIELRELDKEEIEPLPIDEPRLYFTAILGTVALIEGKKAYWVEEGDEVEGWKVVRIERDKVVLYDEEEKKELILVLGAGARERERARREARERRRIEERERAHPEIEEMLLPEEEMFLLPPAPHRRGD